MKLYIWENEGISDGYHDDGTLVVLAESPEQARALAIASADEPDPDCDRPDIWRDAYRGYGEYRETAPAILRDPDRVVELTAPCVVAFNGGGYD